MDNSYHNGFRVLASGHATPRRPPLLAVNPVERNTTSNLDLSSIKVCLKLLQAFHHPEIIEDATTRGSPPTGMAQKVAHLTSFIKPAAPNDTVLNKIKDNTTKWMKQNLTALKNTMLGSYWISALV